MNPPTGSDKWDANQERVFLENLMQTRFNFFLVVFGLWIVGVANITEKVPKLVFLGFGILICFSLDPDDPSDLPEGDRSPQAHQGRHHASSHSDRFGRGAVADYQGQF